jgi:hypothetical protein
MKHSPFFTLIMKTALFRSKPIGQPENQYFASHYVKYEEGLALPFSKELLKSISSTDDEKDSDVIEIDGVKYYPEKLIHNRRGNLYFLSKHTQEFDMTYSKYVIKDPALEMVVEMIPEEDRNDIVFVGSNWVDDSVEKGNTFHFCRIPAPETKLTPVHIAQLYYHCDLPAMDLGDYFKIKAMLQSPDLNSKALGKGLTKRWNPVKSLQFLLMLAHIDKTILEQGPLHYYLKHTSSSVSRTGFSGDLHLDAIDALMELNYYVMYGSPAIYKSRKDGAMDFILNEYNVPTLEKSEKFAFKPQLKKK